MALSEMFSVKLKSKLVKLSLKNILQLLFMFICCSFQCIQIILYSLQYSKGYLPLFLELINM